jgi:hypothetical protein
MTLRKSFQPLRPDLDKFLFAAVGTERDGMPLSMVSALIRLGLDPWEEAGRLSSLGKREAIEQLARLIAELPGDRPPLAEAREIAGELVKQLPERDGKPSPSRTTPQMPWPRLPRWAGRPNRSDFVMFFVVAAAAALVSAILHGGLPFGIGS